MLWLCWLSLIWLIASRNAWLKRNNEAGIIPMPKLIVKHDLPPPSAQDKLISALQVILPIILLIVAVSAAVSLYFSPKSETKQSTLQLSSVSTVLPEVYTRAEGRLNALGMEFEQITDTGKEDYATNLKLTEKAAEILKHIEKMDAMVAELTLDAKDKQTLLARHQYQKDYWESKQVFHRLRLARFKDETTDHPDEKVEKPAKTAEVVPMPENPNPALGETKAETPQQLPEGVKLPPGMCPLFGPGAKECKAGKH